jgi:hypothetical protein
VGRSKRRVVLGYGGGWDQEVRALLLGSGPGQAAWKLAAYPGGVDPDELDRRLLASALDEFADGVEPRPGRPSSATRWRGGYRWRVATNSRRVNAELLLVSAEFTVPVVVCVEDVPARRWTAPPRWCRRCSTCLPTGRDCAVGAGDQLERIAGQAGEARVGERGHVGGDDVFGHPALLGPPRADAYDHPDQRVRIERR